MKTVKQREFSYSVFLFYYRPSKDCMRPAHIGEGNVLYSVY